MSVIRPDAGRCWVVVDADGGPPPWQAEHGQPHHASQADAAGEIADHLDGDLHDRALSYRTVRCDRPCTFVVCADCGTSLADDDAGYVIHFPERWPDLSDYGWTVTTDGRPSCGCQAPDPGSQFEPDRRPGPDDVPLPLDGLTAPDPSARRHAGGRP